MKTTTSECTIESCAEALMKRTEEACNERGADGYPCRNIGNHGSSLTGSTCNVTFAPYTHTANGNPTPLKATLSVQCWPMGTNNINTEGTPTIVQKILDCPMLELPVWEQTGKDLTETDWTIVA